jgi:hypothetical protein
MSRDRSRIDSGPATTSGPSSVPNVCAESVTEGLGFQSSRLVPGSVAASPSVTSEEGQGCRPKNSAIADGATRIAFNTRTCARRPFAQSLYTVIGFTPS